MVLLVLDAHTWDEVQNGKWRSLKMSSSVLQVFKGLQRHQSLWQQLQVIWNSVFILTGWLYFGNNQPWNLSDLTQWKLISLSHTHKLCFFFICGVFFYGNPSYPFYVSTFSPWGFTVRCGKGREYGELSASSWTLPPRITYHTLLTFHGQKQVA